jgi:hypothetical protein
MPRLRIGRKLMEHCIAAKENQIKKNYYLFQQKTDTRHFMKNLFCGSAVR